MMNGPHENSLNSRTVNVGMRVRHIDVALDKARRNGHVGTVVRLLGRRGVGGGIHARVDFDNGGSKIIRPDLLVEVDDDTKGDDR